MEKRLENHSIHYERLDEQLVLSYKSIEEQVLL